MASLVFYDFILISNLNETNLYFLNYHNYNLLNVGKPNKFVTFL